MTESDLHHLTVMVVALIPLAFLLIIWMLEYVGEKLLLAGSWLLGTIALWIMGE